MTLFEIFRMFPLVNINYIVFRISVNQFIELTHLFVGNLFVLQGISLFIAIFSEWATYIEFNIYGEK